MNYHSFLQAIVPELLTDDISVCLYKTDNLDGWGGWVSMEDGEKEFVIAIDHPLGFETSVHEYCHYLQYKNKNDLWVKFDKNYNLLLDWIDNDSLNFSNSELENSLYSIISLEHDCELMTIEFANKNQMTTFKYDQYIKSANAYLWHYHINKLLRQRPKRPIYTEKIISAMDSQIIPDINYYLNINNLSKYQRDIMLEEYNTSLGFGEQVEVRS